MVIDRDIVRQCTEEANGFRTLSRESSMAGSPRTPPPSSRGYRKLNSKMLRSKPVKSLGSESGYGTDTDRSDDYLYSPSASSGSGWTALNTPRSAASEHYQRAAVDQIPPAYLSRLQEAQPSSQTLSKKRARSDEEDEKGEESPSSPSTIDLATQDAPSKEPESQSEETRAAYQLLQLKMDDGIVEGDRSRRRRAST